MFGISLSDENKILLLILLAGVVLYLLSGSYKTEPIHNEGMLTQDPKLSNNFNDVVDVNTSDSPTFDNKSNISGSTGSTNSSESKSSSESTKSSNYKNVSFDKGNRFQKESSSLDKFFEGSYPKKSDNNGFSASVETSNQYAAYTPGNNPKKLTDKQKFDSSALLPREKNAEWFDDPFDQTTSKSSHLINIYRPMGAESIQTTKARSWDIREVPPNPKYPVSPFGNSSWEPDTNINDHALCA